ncbi:trypsin-like serine peptidase [Pseudomonas viridiflava]|uniref:trypsin-like serine peptidase n=1 Tax=Pseudomonas viridiflava TaxID=33069 RepID=UPI000F0210C2|nr:serine protease [Pseudomonas viridiflava]
MHGALQFTRLIGRLTPAGVVFLGTGFFIDEKRLVTAAHVVGFDATGIVIIHPKHKSLDDYQDTLDNRHHCTETTVYDIDPIRDLLILELATAWTKTWSWIPGLWKPENKNTSLASLDDVSVGQKLNIYGFPHCTDNRNVLTHQTTTLGAKVLLQTSKIKSKHGVLNFQSRPGQSGSPILSENGEVVALLVGTYVPPGGYVEVAGTNPASLNQTTHIISAEYIKAML